MTGNEPATTLNRQLPPRRRIRVRISLRALMGLVLVFGVVLGWPIHLARQQRSAVRAILSRGGTVEFDFKYDTAGNRRISKGVSWCPAWLQNAVGDDNFFHHVAVVGMDLGRSGTLVCPTDADMVQLEAFNHLKVLYLGGGRITDSGLEHLKSMTELRMLVLWKNPISGAGLKHLRSMKHLRHLDLSNTAVTDDQLTALRDLTGLERLDLPNNPQLTGSFLEHVADLPNLKELVLRGSGITDSALIHLKRAKNVRALMLDRTKVTDAGLAHLQAVKSLRTLDLNQTAVTAWGVGSLEVASPQVSVIYSPLTRSRSGLELRRSLVLPQED
jgi:hypothetical protein